MHSHLAYHHIDIIEIKYLVENNYSNKNSRVWINGIDTGMNYDNFVFVKTGIAPKKVI